jgi:ribosomal protein L11 methylase PrmA
LRWIAEEHPATMRLVDVGCGSGRLTLAVAPLAAEVIGIDRDGAALTAGCRRAHEMGLTNVRFVRADAEVSSYTTLVGAASIDMVVANLCLSNAIIERAYTALPVGGCLICTALHTAQWQEAGYRSRFAYDANELRNFLVHNGWRCEAMEIDTEVLHIQRLEDLEQYFADSPIRARWQRDGRWKRLVQHIASGGERFTVRSHLLVKARKI